MDDYAIAPEQMRTPVQSGAALAADIAAARPAPGRVAIWWLGQSGYAIRTASALFYVDLYLSEHLTAKYAHTAKPHVRMTHAPLRWADLPAARWLFSSHKHSDHLDPGTLPNLLAAHPDSRLILPAAIVDHACGLGLDPAQLLPMRGDDSLMLDGLTVHALPSAHPGLDYDSATGYPFLGFVFQADGVTLYHSGDTVVYEGLADRLRRFAVDIAFLPINGTDARRAALEVPPNMGIDDALTLAETIGGPLVIPHHYDMFTFNTVDVAAFEVAAAQRGAHYRVLRAGQRFDWLSG